MVVCLIIAMLLSLPYTLKWCKKTEEASLPPPLFHLHCKGNKKLGITGLEDKERVE